MKSTTESDLSGPKDHCFRNRWETTVRIRTVGRLADALLACSPSSTAVVFLTTRAHNDGSGGGCPQCRLSLGKAAGNGIPTQVGARLYWPRTRRSLLKMVRTGPGDEPQWIGEPANVSPPYLRWTLRIGAVAGGRTLWILREQIEREELAHVLNVPNRPTAWELTLQIEPLAGPEISETLVREALAMLPEKILDTRDG